MTVGIGFTAAVRDAEMSLIGEWAAEAERYGFASVGVIDRLIYENLDPLTSLAASAATTERLELIGTVINVNWRNNAVLLAKQLSSVQRLSGGRLTAGLGMGPAGGARRPVKLGSRATMWAPCSAYSQRCLPSR